MAFPVILASELRVPVLTSLSHNRNCAFVNFTNISNAIKAIEGIKNKPDYANLRIAHGKDRCANPPRSGPQGSSGMRRSASGNGPNSAGPLSAIDGEGVVGVDGLGIGGVGMESEAIMLGEDLKEEEEEEGKVDA